VKHSRTQATGAADEPANVHPLGLLLVVAVWLVLYLPLTWSAQQGSWSALRSQPFATYRALLLGASIALWAAPACALVATPRIARRSVADGRPRLVLAYLQTITIILVVVIETIIAGLLFTDGSTVDLTSERWLTLSLIVASAAICGGVEHLGRIARNSPRGAQCGPATDLKWARRCGLVAGIAALFAAPLSYVNRTTTPTAGATALFAAASVAWFVTTHMSSIHPHQ
jgi:hypothetical protein